MTTDDKPKAKEAAIGCLTLIVFTAIGGALIYTCADTNAGDATNGDAMHVATPTQVTPPPMFAEWAACRDAVVERLKSTGEQSTMFPAALSRPLTQLVSTTSDGAIKCTSVASSHRDSGAPTCTAFDFTMRKEDNVWRVAEDRTWDQWEMIETDCRERPAKP